MRLSNYWPGELVEVDVLADVHLSRVDLHDSGSGLLGRTRELDLPVETAGTEQSRIQNVDTIRCGNDL